MLYDGEPVELTADQEEIANMFGVMKETDYMKKQIFLDNFWADWRKVLCFLISHSPTYLFCIVTDAQVKASYPNDQGHLEAQGTCCIKVKCITQDCTAFAVHQAQTMPVSASCFLGARQEPHYQRFEEV